MLRNQMEPDLMSAVTMLATYTTDHLKQLVADDEQIATYVKNLPQCQELSTAKDLKLVQNKSLAEYNLNMAPILERGKANLIELCAKCEDLYGSAEKKANELKATQGGDISLDTALALLQSSAAETEEESEKLAELLYQKEIEVDEFLDQFQATRKRMHLRKLKADKMKDLVVDQKNTSNSSQNQFGRSPYTRPAPPPPPAAPLPYPVPGINNTIPMPNPFFK